jgi:hypothetical protein
MKSSKRIFAALLVVLTLTGLAESQTCTEISNNPGQKADETLNVIQSGGQYNLPLNTGHLKHGNHLLKVKAGMQTYVTNLSIKNSNSGQSLIRDRLFYQLT